MDNLKEALNKILPQIEVNASGSVKNKSGNIKKIDISKKEN